MKKRLPGFLRKFFWDQNFNSLNLEKSRQFMLEILLVRGDTKTIRWVFRNFTKKEFKELLLTSPSLDPKTANFLADLLKVNKEKVVSLKILSKKFKNKPYYQRTYPWNISYS